MEFPFDILDSIFFFLRPHPQSLIACSKAHPIFSQAAERHLYYHITFHSTSRHYAQTTGNGYSPRPSNLIKLLSETPHIASYVRILQIDFSGLHDILIKAKIHNFRTITPILSMFPTLKCIILMAPYHSTSWKQLPQSFRTAVENCLHLPTLEEVHVGHLEFPLSILNNQVNINYFLLSGFPQIPILDDTNLQLRTLSFDVSYSQRHLEVFITWVKRQIVNLQSLKCVYLNEKMISELLEICSGTLNSLDIVLKEPYEMITLARAVHGTSTSLINLSSLPHLQHLTIRADIYYQKPDDDYDDYGRDENDYYYISHLPAVVIILKTTPPLGQLHLIIDIHINLADSPYYFFSEDNLPLFPDFFTVLAESSASFPHIDLYIHSSYGITDIEILSLFGDYGRLTASIEQGALVIHVQETAPGNSQFVDIFHDRWR